MSKECYEGIRYQQPIPTQVPEQQAQFEDNPPTYQQEQALFRENPNSYAQAHQHTPGNNQQGNKVVQTTCQLVGE